MTAPAPRAAAAATRPAGPAGAVRGLNGPQLSEAEFSRIAAIAYSAAGLAIGAGKSAMVRSRLARRLRALGLPDFAAYCAVLDGPDGAAEVNMLVSALTTNVSHFFREKHHFETLSSKVLPPLLDRARAGHRIRIWSAGCSNGQEPFSIAMTLLEAGMPADRDIRVLATDIDPNVVAHAREGTYDKSMLSGLSDELREKYFEPVPAPRERLWRASDQLRGALRFRELNLLDPWPMRGQFDAIFCRNVVIYFDAGTQDRLWRRFATHLKPGGWLFIGHSERLSSAVQPQFAGRGVTTYQLADRPRDPAPRTGAQSKGY